MKNGLFLTVAALLFSAPFAFGQPMGLGDGKIDVGAIKKSMEESDAAIKDPKTSEKWMTWLQRGDIYFEAASAPTKGLFIGLDESQMSKLYPQKPVAKPAIKLKGKDGDVEYKVNEYDRFIVYFANKKLSMWTDNKIVIDSTALDKAADAYDYAYALDAKATERALKGIQEVVRMVKSRAQTYYRLGITDKAGDEYRRSYIIQQYPTVGKVDTTDLFYAAMAFSSAGKFNDALQCLNELKKLGYYADGDVYYYKYFCFNNMESHDSARLTLLEGARKFPNVSKLYRTLPIMYAIDTSADINDIVPIIDKALADPANKEKPALYFGMGQAYAQRDMNDKALEYFIKAADADPKNYSYQFNTALTYIKKGDQEGREMQEHSENLSQAEYVKARDEVYAIHALAIPYLEKAHELEKDNESVIEILAGLTFRLRDTSPEMMEKSKKYEAMNEAIKAKAGNTAEAPAAK